MPLHADDDTKIHPPTASPDWRESYYCNFFDHTGGGLYGVAWQGVRPNAGRGEAVFALFDGDSALVRSVNFGVPVARDIGPERTGLVNQCFENIEPWSHWAITYEDERATLRVEWRRLSQICDWEWEDITNSKHYQVAGTVSVNGVVDGRDIAFTGFGERDRAWGERNYAGLVHGWWQTVQFPDGVAAHVFTLDLGEGPVRLHGYLHADGETRRLQQCIATDVAYDPQTTLPVNVHQRLIDDAGRELTVTALRPLQWLSFVSDGAEVYDRAPTVDESVQSLTFQEFVRSDGVVGRGMVDLTAAAGARPSHFGADGSAFSTLYDYGDALVVGAGQQED